MAQLVRLVSLAYFCLLPVVHTLDLRSSTMASLRQGMAPRRGFLAVSSLALLPAAPSVAAQPTQVVLDVDGTPRTFDAIPLPTGFDKGLELPIRDITSKVFQPPGNEKWPYTAVDMRRLDESDDASFYDAPKYNSISYPAALLVNNIRNCCICWPNLTYIRVSLSLHT
jgi:hypothetical protein